MCHCDGLILRNYAIVDAWWPSWSGLAIRGRWVKSKINFLFIYFLLQNCIGVDDIRGDEYSEVTYSTQRAMAGDRKQTCSWFVWHACVSRESLNTIMHNHWTKHVTHHTNSLFIMNVISNFTRYISTRWHRRPNNVTYTYIMFWQTRASPEEPPTVNQHFVSHGLNVSPR